ncbi:MAG TPA: hypothetical protein VFX49_08575, partial [Chloroflexota bacterium]|nr:hypothetical protein [Chloroflexota bacterium]
LANAASMPIGLWAVATVVDEAASRRRLTVQLAATLFYLSITYQYQWFAAPAAGILMAFKRSIGPRSAALVLFLSLALFAIATAGLRGALVFSGLAPAPDRLAAVNEPSTLIKETVSHIHDTQSLLAELPGQAQIRETAAAYHPLVYALGLAGLLLRGARGVSLGALAFVLPLFFVRLYPPPWVAMTAYPLVYLGAAHACDSLGRTLAVVSGRRRWPTVAVALLAGAVLFALSNGDLWGDPGFLLRWWDLYSPRPIY